MKHTLLPLLMLLGCAVFAEPAPAAPASPGEALVVPTVAVLPFEARERGAETADAGKSVAELLTVALMESGCADLVERAELEKALNELQLSAVGLTDKESQVKLGKFVGAKILITGSLFRSGDKNYLVAKVIGTETSRVLGSSVSGTDEFTGMVPELASKLAAILEKQSARLLPKAEEPESAAQELVAKIKGNGRKVFVKVREDISVSTPDPAAETALKKLLLRLGFTVVDSREGADFVILGEAVAANAGMYQKFSSASARVELSILTGDRKLLASGADKETMAGATYVIAAKEAIASAALRLSRELFPVMK